MNTLYNILTAIPRWWHRKGFGVQSPSDYVLVRDVLFESLHYYAYDDQGLRSEADRQMYRIRLWRPDVQVVTSAEEYERVAGSADDATVVVVDDIAKSQSQLWRTILADERARVTFDMRFRGLILFNSKRIKQNYIL